MAYLHFASSDAVCRDFLKNHFIALSAVGCLNVPLRSGRLPHQLMMGSVRDMNKSNGCAIPFLPLPWRRGQCREYHLRWMMWWVSDRLDSPSAFELGADMTIVECWSGYRVKFAFSNWNSWDENGIVNYRWGDSLIGLWASHHKINTRQ